MKRSREWRKIDAYGMSPCVGVGHRGPSGDGHEGTQPAKYQYSTAVRRKEAANVTVMRAGVEVPGLTTKNDGVTTWGGLMAGFVGAATSVTSFGGESGHPTPSESCVTHP